MTPTDRIAAAIIPTDQAARDAERRWGVGRLYSLVSSVTLLHWQRGWALYSQAIRDNDADAVERLAPKIRQAILAMSAEAEAAGHAPLSPSHWEAALPDGRVLVVTRTTEEAHAVQATLDGRHAVVWTMGELACVLPQLEQLQEIKREFPGSTVRRATQRSPGFAHDWATSDPLFETLHTEAA